MGSSAKDNHPLSYAERLSQHVDEYILSVIDHPAVRIQEFTQLKDIAQLRHPCNIFELPAEGRMLDLLYPSANIHRADFLKLNIEGYAENVMVTDWRFSGIPSNAFDAVLAVVPMHHASRAEKRDYLRGARRVLRDGGVLAFGEVENGSSVHRFLDEFIERHTGTGHKGEYPGLDFSRELESAGFVDVTSEIRDCPWCFETPEALHAYMVRFFALDSMSPDFLLDSLDSCLGLTQVNGKIMLNWSLCYFRGVKTAIGKPG